MCWAPFLRWCQAARSLYRLGCRNKNRLPKRLLSVKMRFSKKPRTSTPTPAPTRPEEYREETHDQHPTSRSVLPMLAIGVLLIIALGAVGATAWIVFNHKPTTLPAVPIVEKPVNPPPTQAAEPSQITLKPKEPLDTEAGLPSTAIPVWQLLADELAKKESRKSCSQRHLIKQRSANFLSKFWSTKIQRLLKNN